jgi:ubiquitin-protein ligase
VFPVSSRGIKCKSGDTTLLALLKGKRREGLSCANLEWWSCLNPQAKNNSATKQVASAHPVSRQSSQRNSFSTLDQHTSQSEFPIHTTLYLSITKAISLKFDIPPLGVSLQRVVQRNTTHIPMSSKKSSSKSSSSKSPSSKSSSSNSTAAKRLIQELSSSARADSSSRNPSIERLGPVSDDDLFHWEAVITGKGLGGGYERGRWLVDIVIPDGNGKKEEGSYPIVPPKVRFVTKICAANVAFEVCILHRRVPPHT